MSTDLLAPFQIRNLRSSIQSTSRDTQDNVVRVSGPGYEKTISTNPDASLRYRDEDGDKITVSLYKHVYFTFLY